MLSHRLRSIRHATDGGFDSYVKLLMHFDGSWTDETGKTVTPVNSPTIDTSDKVFGSGSGNFLALSYQYLSVPDSADWQLDGGSNSNEWSIDFRTKITNVASNRGLLAQRADGSNFWALIWLSTGYLRFRVDSGGATIIKIDNSWTPSTTSWYHVAIIKQGVTGYKMFIDGVQIGTTQTDTSTIPDFSGDLRVAYGNDNYLTGNIDELRISKGIARWTSNFTPPTIAYY